MVLAAARRYHFDFWIFSLAIGMLCESYSIIFFFVRFVYLDTGIFDQKVIPTFSHSCFDVSFCWSLGSGSHRQVQFDVRVLSFCRSEFKVWSKRQVRGSSRKLESTSTLPFIPMARRCDHTLASAPPYHHHQQNDIIIHHNQQHLPLPLPIQKVEK